MLHGSQLTVRRNGRNILDDVSVSVIGGELLALLGSGGAGKSMLLRTLAGDIKPTHGQVWLAGKPVRAWSLRERAIRRAILPQKTDVAFPLSSLEVVRMGRSPHFVMSPSPQDTAIAQAALRWVHADHLQQRLYPTLSGGERQQVLLARILAQIWGRPKQGDCYVFLDEPTAGLDLVHQHRCLAIAKQLAHDGAAVVVVLQDLNLAAQFCDRLLMLQAGRVIAEGRPREVLTEPTLRTVFGIATTVVPHPRLNCPMVIPAIQVGQSVMPQL